MQTLRVALVLSYPSTPQRTHDIEHSVRRALGACGRVVEIRPIYRTPDVQSLFLGHPHHRMAYEMSADIMVVEGDLNAWDLAFGSTPMPLFHLQEKTSTDADDKGEIVPMLARFYPQMPGFPESGLEIGLQDLDPVWKYPSAYFSGSLGESLQKEPQVALLEPGCGRRPEDDVAIALSPLSAWDDPAPDAFIVDDSAVTAPGVLGVYPEVQWGMKVQFPVSATDEEMADPALQHLEEDERRRMLEATDQEGAQGNFWGKAIARSSMALISMARRCGHTLFTPCMNVRLSNGMELMDNWSILAFALLTANPNLRVVHRHAPRFETGPGTVMEYVALQQEFPDRFAHEETGPSNNLQRIRVDIEGEGIPAAACAPIIAEWLRAVRYGDPESTWVSTDRHYAPFFRAHGFPEPVVSENKPVATVKLAPKPLYH